MVVVRIPVLTPLHDVAVHVIKPEGVRLFLPDWMRQSIAIRAVPRNASQIGFGIA